MCNQEYESKKSNNAISKDQERAAVEQEFIMGARQIVDRGKVCTNQSFCQILLAHLISQFNNTLGHFPKVFCLMSNQWLKERTRMYA